MKRWTRQDPNSPEPVLAHAESTDVSKAADGDHDAFERLYRGHVGRVYALARRMVDDQSAEELTQEVFIRAWQKLPGFRGEARFGTWLHRLAVNHILTRRESIRKREARHETGEGLMDRLVASGQRNAGVAIDLEAALRRLPDGARQVFVLFDVEGYGHDEIAESMGISVGTSKSQLHRARMLLRGHLNA
jgi:RNA polymerase sigma-70 factor (ECF subfamily)